MNEHDGYPKGSADACQKVYEQMDLLSHAIEILGCWVLTPRRFYSLAVPWQ